MSTKRKTRRKIRKDPTLRLDNAHEFLTASEAALKIFGWPSDENTRNEHKLKWLFKFLETDLTKLSARNERIYGECVRQLSGSYQTEGFSRFLIGEELADYQQIISQGIQALFDDDRRDWTISPPKELRLFRMSPITTKGANFQFIVRGDERSGILWGVLELLWKLPGRVRACNFCRKPILKTKRQEYCSEQCSRAQREKNRQQSREKARLFSLLGKLNVISQLSGDDLSEKQTAAKELRQKLTTSKSTDEFWKAVPNGTGAVLKRFLAMRGRKPKKFN
jgi:hypothetical protein